MVLTFAGGGKWKLEDDITTGTEGDKNASVHTECHVAPRDTLTNSIPGHASVPINY